MASTCTRHGTSSVTRHSVSSERLLRPRACRSRATASPPKAPMEVHSIQTRPPSRSRTTMPPLEFDTTVDVSWLSVVNGSGVLDQDEEAVITSPSIHRPTASAMASTAATSPSVETTEHFQQGVDLTVGTPVAIYSYDLATGWTMEGQWAGVSHPDGGAYAIPIPRVVPMAAPMSAVSISMVTTRPPLVVPST